MRTPQRGAMATKIWMARGSIDECDELAEKGTQFLAELAARGGRYRQTHTAMTNHDGQPLVLLKIVYEDKTSNDAASIPIRSRLRHAGRRGRSSRNKTR